jgi:hypothetical protein
MSPEPSVVCKSSKQAADRNEFRQFNDSNNRSIGVARCQAVFFQENHFLVCHHISLLGRPLRLVRHGPWLPTPAYEITAAYILQKLDQVGGVRSSEMSGCLSIHLSRDACSYACNRASNWSMSVSKRSESKCSDFKNRYATRLWIKAKRES